VNDYAGLLPADARQRLESRLAEREAATGAQMVIAVFPSLEGENLEDFGIRLAERWRVGRRELDSGVILLVFVRERRVRMEVGYGLEPVLTDAVAGQVIREHIAPRFREERYAAGLEAAVEAVYARVESKGAPPPPPRGVRLSPWTIGLLVIFGIVFLILAREAMSGGRRGYTASRRGWSSGGVVLPPIWWGGGGGHRRGGGGGGGWGGGGGFSPGGGSFGGGGASGSW
jgi:uncharacterized protein